MALKKLKEFLDENSVRYVTISHSPAYTAQEMAAKAHLPGKEIAKTVLVKIDGKLAMTVLPGSYKINFEELKKVTGSDNVRLADEHEFIDKFPDCEVGAMPPFGNLYGIEVFVARSLAEDEEIAFNACSHSQLIKMSYADYEKLVKPVRLDFAFQSKL
ncbi:MAG TPA: YbaK/EbsC family protein [Ignavibacteriaceae bacterium]|nr:YbaK/EbsC family protein [Ignavibacteriaceae bacterium]